MEEHIFLYSFLLIFLALAIAHREKLGNEKEIALSSVRTAIQLLLLGYVLKYLLKLTSLWELLLIVLMMSCVSSFIAYERVKHRKILLTSFLSITTPSFLTLLLLLIVGILKPTPNEVIPFGGLMVGNILNSITLAFDRLVGEVRNRIDEIEAKVSLGASLRLAMKEIFVSSMRASLIPKINFMKAAGLVHIPGVAVGMLIAGADPMRAILFQIVILYSLVFGGLLGTFIMLYTSYRTALTLAGR